MKPFNLEAAKRGDPIVTRDGRDARFIALVPEAVEEGRVVVYVDGANIPDLYCESGKFLNDDCERPKDLFMKRRERTIYLNLQKTERGALMPFWYDNAANARALYEGDNLPPHVLCVAHPIVINE